jgi:hypothetical protein
VQLLAQARATALLRGRHCQSAGSDGTATRGWSIVQHDDIASLCAPLSFHVQAPRPVVATHSGLALLTRTHVVRRGLGGDYSGATDTVGRCVPAAHCLDISMADAVEHVVAAAPAQAPADAPMRDAGSGSDGATAASAGSSHASPATDAGSSAATVGGGAEPAAGSKGKGNVKAGGSVTEDASRANDGDGHASGSDGGEGSDGAGSSQSSNRSYCNVCKGDEEGEMLVCCEHCPRSFHPRCLDPPGMPESDPWLCSHCTAMAERRRERHAARELEKENRRKLVSAMLAAME